LCIRICIPNRRKAAGSSFRCQAQTMRPAHLSACASRLPPSILWAVRYIPSLQNLVSSWFGARSGQYAWIRLFASALKRCPLLNNHFMIGIDGVGGSTPKTDSGELLKKSIECSQPLT
jgi:hypothetical protein